MPITASYAIRPAVDSLAAGNFFECTTWLILGILAIEAAAGLRHDEAKAYTKYGRKDARVGGMVLGSVDAGKE